MFDEVIPPCPSPSSVSNTCSSVADSDKEQEKEILPNVIDYHVK